jgi:hypothetical protein
MTRKERMNADYDGCGLRIAEWNADDAKRTDERGLDDCGLRMASPLAPSPLA